MVAMLYKKVLMVAGTCFMAACEESQTRVLLQHGRIGGYGRMWRHRQQIIPLSPQE
jgi:hypothetical protein